MEKETNETDETMILSLSLTNILSTSKEDKEVIAQIKKEGLPMEFSSEDVLIAYFYLHQMLIPFYSYLTQIEDSTGKALMNLLIENYYLLSDYHCNTLNIKAIVKSIGLKNKISSSTNNSNRICISLKGEKQSSKGNFELNKTMLDLGKDSRGRLDIYIKAHIAKNIILFSGFEQFNAYSKIYGRMEDDLTKIYQTGTNERFTQKEYEECVELFVNGEKRDDWYTRISHYIKMLSIYQNINDTESIARLERLFVQLLGHSTKEVRNEAVITLNLIYDETSFQDRKAFDLAQTKVQLLNEEWNLDLIVRKQDFIEQGTILVTSSPSKNPSIKNNIFSWIKCKNETVIDDKYIKLSYHFGLLPKCGYYDWSLMKFNEGQFSSVKIVNIETEKLTEGKGRLIVYDYSIKDLSVHEVYCDLIQAKIDKEQGKIVERGNFSTLEAKLDEYSQRYVNCLYIMGALERDNNIAYEEHTGASLDIALQDASPMAVTCRSKISNLLGGDPAFFSLMAKAKKLSIKVILDSLTRISSSRSHRRYKDILLHYLDENGKLQICYGTDGHSVRYDDSALLNYRKVETWNLLIEEIISLASKFKIDGIHLDNCQSWPQIMEVDIFEMYRIDPDGELSHKKIDILNGEIVRPNKESGYYDSELYETYANPFLVKLSREIWKEFPSFVFFGECWLNDKFSNRHCQLAKSGIIPRLYTLPIIISEILGKKASRNGSIENIQPKNVNTIKEWYVHNYKRLPEGALLVQSSCGQVWPYPALLYGRGNWSAVDLLFGLPDIPMTFMDEIDGEAYRVQIINVYQAQDTNKSQASQFSLKKRSKSLSRLIEIKEEESKNEENKQKISQEYIPQYNLTQNIKAFITLSGLDIHEAMYIKSKQEQIVKEIGPEFGFNLNLIKHHYDHRRKMRYTHECLRRGNLIYLNALDHNNQPHYGVFAFARRTVDETGVFAINFTNNETNFLLDMNNLTIGNEIATNFNAICHIEDWINEVKGEFFFLREMIGGQVHRKINVSI